MRKITLLVGSALILCFSNLTMADTKTDDSTNTYTPSDQYNEKLHQKPVAEDANSGSDMSTTKDTSAHKDKNMHKKNRMTKKKTKSDTDSTSSTSN